MQHHSPSGEEAESRVPGHPTPACWPKPWLLADIGGTSARFGWLAEGSRQVGHVRTLVAAEFAGPGPAAQAYLVDLAADLGSDFAAPRAAAFAVATAVSGDEVAFTNSGWTFSRAAVRAELGLDGLLVLNDFEALALSLPHLCARQLAAIGAPANRLPACAAAEAAGASAAALAVIGPGTGLGVAGMVPAFGAWLAIPGEGGHASLAAANDFEAALLAQVRTVFSHVSAERLLSGIGLPVLHGATAVLLARPSPVLSPRDIVDGALGHHDPVCLRTLEVFCALLGGFAGNVALTLGARGGVFIGGGIVPRLGDFFMRSEFRARFEAKGRFQPYLQSIPTWLITDTLAALTGAASALAAARR